ncbi:MAG: sodium-translocating pyrophosphatase [Brevinematales bacterium]|nr:sodium-translocating pyrophosphatase [Brevinematales bacterium]
MEGKITLPQFGPVEWGILFFVLASSIVALVYGLFLVRYVIRVNVDDKKMLEVSSAIEEGAMAYLRRQFNTMIWFIIGLMIVLFFVYSTVYTDIRLPLGIAIAFLMGVFASYGAGFVGMWLSVKANVRTAYTALTKSFSDALKVSFRAGAVSGMFTLGFGLLGATIIFMAFREEAMKVLVGFGFGAALAALFMRVGGGIYTKAADVGADLVGKVEKGIPEDDPRNAATIADNVGDNVGDCAGMTADVFESYEVTLVAAIILAAATLLDPVFTQTYGQNAEMFALKLIMFPLILRAIGVFSSMVGVWSVRMKEDEQDPMRGINRGYIVSSILSIIGFAIVIYFYIIDPNTGQPDFRFLIPPSIGIFLAVVTMWLTDYFTHPDKKPATEVSYSSKTGPATVILTGMGVGLESTVWAIVVIAGTIGGALLVFPDNLSLAAYSIALTGLGLLTTTGYILAMDTYGPITDNAHGIFEMSGVKDQKASKVLDRMDAIGNTTKALTKGLAIATAVIAAISLFRSFIDEAQLFLKGIQINLPDVFIGLLIGGAVPFLFSSFAIKAVGRAAFLVVEEVRRQFREKPGIMEWKEKPDYGKTVDIVTAAAQKELIGPGILAIFSPILVGFLLGAQALGGFLAGAILTGQLLAVFMANSGGVWDNAKKKIEDGFLGGKGTDEHKAAVVGDTVGDPFKDTAGPSLNPLIKVINLVSLLIAPVVILELSVWLKLSIVVFAIILLGIAVMLSKRGAITEEKK